MKKLHVLLLVFFFTALLFSGCTTDSGTGETDGTAPGEEMVLTYNVSTEPETMDVHLSTGVPEATIMLQIYEGLTRLNNDSLPELALAESVDISEDNLVYTFHLRDGLV